MFDNFDAYTGQVVSSEEIAQEQYVEPTPTPEETSADLIAEAEQKAAQIISEAQENAGKIAQDGLLGQLLMIENEKQRQLDQAIETLTGMVGDVVEEIIGNQPQSELTSKIFKTALKRFDEKDPIIVEAAKDVFPRLQLLSRIDGSRNPDRLNIVERADLDKGQIIIIHGEQRFYADAATQIEMFRRAVMSVNDRSARA